MKKRLFALIILFMASSLFAQEKTLMGDGCIEHGGFGGPVVKFSSMNDNFAVLVGGRGGWILNHTLILGGGGYGLVNEIDMGVDEFGKKTKLTMGYGGFEMGYILNSDEVMHFTVDLLLGAGGVGVREKGEWGDWDEDRYDGFFIAEPGFNIELNIVKYFRINLGGSYRFVNGVEEYGLKNSDLSGPSANLTLKFGSF